MKEGHKMLNAGSEAAIEYQDRHSIVIDGNAQTRLQMERQRIADMKISATPPAECGWLIPSAPGRGGFVMFMPTTLQDNDNGDMEVVPTGHAGRSTIRSADVFDQMIAAAERQKKSWPLTPGQIAIGRRYRDLVEWRAKGAIKCSTIDGRAAGSGERDFMDAYLSVGRELDGMRRRIGSMPALQVRRIRPSHRGADPRKLFTSRDLVDMVCVGGKSVRKVLVHFGWQINSRNYKATSEALCAALDRMIGYRYEKSS